MSTTYEAALIAFLEEQVSRLDKERETGERPPAQAILGETPPSPRPIPKTPPLLA